MAPRQLGGLHKRLRFHVRSPHRGAVLLLDAEVALQVAEHGRLDGREGRRRQATIEDGVRVLCFLFCHGVASRSIRHQLRLRSDRLLLFGVLLLFPLIYYVTHVSERYRFPIEALLVFLDVWLVMTLWEGRRYFLPAETR